MTKEEIISMLSKELNSEWTNGVTCLMVENSDSYIPVIVHHNKNELIVEVVEQDKKIYRIGRNELNKTSQSSPKKSLKSTTYTINNFVGRMVDLIALVVGALTLPNIVAEAFLDALIKGLGITVASGMIKNAVTDTVSCIKTQYTWNLVDTTAASHQKNVYGYKYYITDVKSAAKNNNYYEGYVPKDWKTQSLAVNFHNEMFTYNAWNVVGWA